MGLVADFLRRPGKFWIWLGLIALVLGSFIELTFELARRDAAITLFDYWVLDSILRLRSSGLNGIMVDLTALGSPTIVTLLSILFFIVFMLLKDRTGALHLLAASIGGGILSALFKNAIARERPTLIPRLVEVSGFSYPSGHALFAAAIYLTLAILACRHFRRWQQRAVIFSLSIIVIGLVAISRVYLGVHYPSDVASGILLGAAWAFILGALVSNFYRNRVEIQSDTNQGRK